VSPPKAFVFSPDGRKLAMLTTVDEDGPQIEYAHEVQVFNLTDPSRLPQTRFSFPKGSTNYSGLQFHANKQRVDRLGQFG